MLKANLMHSTSAAVQRRVATRSAGCAHAPARPSCAMRASHNLASTSSSSSQTTSSMHGAAAGAAAAVAALLLGSCTPAWAALPAPQMELAELAAMGSYEDAAMDQYDQDMERLAEV